LKQDPFWPRSFRGDVKSMKVYRRMTDAMNIMVTTSYVCNKMMIIQCSCFVIVSDISTHGIIVCFFLFQAIYYIAQFLLFWDSYTQLI
jgi:hypothetical protein